MAFPASFKRRSSITLGVALLLIAAVAMVLGQNFVVRSAGLLALVGGLKLLRGAKGIGQVSPVAAGSGVPPPTRTMWLAGVALAVVQVITLYLLYLDAVGGYREAWPLYAFTATATVCSGFFAALFARRQQ
ncbi:hypothetical protein [Dyella sp. 20L07]|uniref:hypothetical protein n=1 Tax=Dyella sp. 20L07 TaxID=3384240 RepID=UPI003D2DA2C6